MRRRTLLKSVLTLPMAASAAGGTSSAGDQAGAFFSGLAGFDYALGGLKQGSLACIVGPPCMGKTLLLLELAARIVRRYGRNVVFFSAQKPSVYVAKKAVLRNDMTVVFAGETAGDLDSRTEGSAIYLLDANSADIEQAFEFTRRLRHGHPAGCALVILDGWSTYTSMEVDGEAVCGAGFPAARWAHENLSRRVLVCAQRFSHATRMPVVMGVTTASLLNKARQVNSLDLEAAMRIAADRWVSLHRPAVYEESAKFAEEQRNVVCLTGTSPQWWDTRCSKLRFDPRRMGFDTVV